jgi:hypothetical protein
MALLDSIREGFADRNAPLYALLGLISLARRLDAFLPPSADATKTPPPPPPPTRSPGDDPLLYLLLGMISLRRTLLSELEPLRAAHRTAGERRSRDAIIAPLLRDLLR